MFRVIVAACLISLLSGVASADTYTIWYHQGEFVGKNPLPCGENTRTEMAEVFARTPTLEIEKGKMTLQYTVSKKGTQVKVASYVAENEDCFKVEHGMVGVFHLVENKRLVVKVLFTGKMPSVEVSSIQYGTDGNACSEKWLGALARSK